MTCRDEVLAAAEALTLRSGDDTFTLSAVVAEMARRNTVYKASTIRTHVTSKQCSNAPVHHADHSDDFERVGSGVYRLLRGSR